MKNNIICFHNPNESNGFLSNWYLSNFTLNGIVYTSMEQYMMYMKAITFDDIETAEKILNTTDVATIKALGRQVRNYNDSIWAGMRQILVYEGLKAKFSQNSTLRKMLLNTGSSVLAECAVKDKIWGIGLSMSDPNRFNIANWRGLNLLGYSLMLVRFHLKVV
jgi:ribA/ribD-fused uncharacterized protein